MDWCHMLPSEANPELREPWLLHFRQGAPIIPFLNSSVNSLTHVYMPTVCLMEFDR